MSIYYMAKQQLTLILRSRWLVSFGCLFTLLAIFVAYFGDAGQSGFSGFNRMTASLLNLNLLLIPLISLLIGSLFIAGEKEDRRLMLQLTYPLPSRVLLFGKYVGLLVALVSVITFGYGASALVMFFINSSTSIMVLFSFYLFSIILAMIFLSIALLIGLWSKTRFQALGISLIIWAFSVLFYEFIVMGLSLFVTKQWILPMLTTSILINPVELIRVWSILSLNGASVFGPSLYDLTIWANDWVGKLLFIASAVAWVVIPLWLSKIIIKRRLGNE